MAWGQILRNHVAGAKRPKTPRGTQGITGQMGLDAYGPQPPKPKKPKVNIGAALPVQGPGSTTAPAQTPLPYDPNYEAAINAADLTLGNAQTDFTAGINATNQNYGIHDTSNPFSRMALLQQHYAQAKKGTQTGLAGAGHLYSGSMQNAQNRNQLNFAQNTDSLNRAYDAAIAQLVASLRDARTNNLNTKGAAAANRISNATSNSPTNVKLS